MALAVDGAARIQIEACNGSVTVLDVIKCLTPGGVEDVAVSLSCLRMLVATPGDEPRTSVILVSDMLTDTFI
jgi:propanediol dehydratase large subunit